MLTLTIIGASAKRRAAGKKIFFESQIKPTSAIALCQNSDAARPTH